MHPPRLAAALKLLAAGILFAACNSAAGTAGPGATATSATGSTPGTSAAANPTPGASIDFGGAAVGLSNLTSYKVSVVSGDTSVEATIVNSPVKAKQVVDVSGGTTTRIVEIGPDVWVDQGTGTFVKNALPASAVDAMLSGFDPGVFMAGFASHIAINQLPVVGVENKNGVNATHIHADGSTQLPAGASPLPVGATGDLWVAVDGGYLVALETTGMAASGQKDVKIEVTNVNDPSLSVTPPA
jgi:hypothetical protein